MNEVLQVFFRIRIDLGCPISFGLKKNSLYFKTVITGQLVTISNHQPNTITIVLHRHRWPHTNIRSPNTASHRIRDQSTVHRHTVSSRFTVHQSAIPFIDHIITTSICQRRVRRETVGSVWTNLNLISIYLLLVKFC